MTYRCPKGHESTDSDYCSECGALIGDSKLTSVETEQMPDMNLSADASAGSVEVCPDCGTPRVSQARFCEVCRHDFENNKTGVAEAIVASQQTAKPPVTSLKSSVNSPVNAIQAEAKPNAASSVAEKVDFVVAERLNVVIAVDSAKAASCEAESEIKPDSKERTFPLDLDENLVGRRSTGKGIYPEIEINDPGVSRRHLKFIKQPDGSFAALELGSANGTELNGATLEPGVNTAVKAGDVLTIGIWTQLKIVGR